MRRDVRSAVQELDEGQRHIICAGFGIGTDAPSTWTQIGQAIGLTANVAYSARNQALSVLGHIMARKHLRLYL